MSIYLTIKAPGLTLNATLKDDALTQLIELTQSHRDEQAEQATTGGDSVAPTASKPTLFSSTTEEDVKNHLRQFGAAELLNRAKCDIYPEKILLLAAWYETHGGNPGWRSADMHETFKQ